jgi:hypothetical protein
MKPRLVESIDEMRAQPRSRLAAFLDALDSAELAVYGPDPWGPLARVLEVVGKPHVIARIAKDAGGLDARSRNRLAREGWFVFDSGTERAVHVRVITPQGAEIIALFVEAFRRSELRCSAPRWRYEATRKRCGFRTVFTFVDRPSEKWILMLLENIGRRLEADVEHSQSRGRIDGRVGDIDLTFELPL